MWSEMAIFINRARNSCNHKSWGMRRRTSVRSWYSLAWWRFTVAMTAGFGKCIFVRSNEGYLRKRCKRATNLRESGFSLPHSSPFFDQRFHSTFRHAYGGSQWLYPSKRCITTPSCSMKRSQKPVRVWAHDRKQFTFRRQIDPSCRSRWERNASKVMMRIIYWNIGLKTWR
jgi:hypothetical protein